MSNNMEVNHCSGIYHNWSSKPLLINPTIITDGVLKLLCRSYCVDFGENIFRVTKNKWFSTCEDISDTFNLTFSLHQFLLNLGLFNASVTQIWSNVQMVYLLTTDMTVDFKSLLIWWSHPWFNIWHSAFCCLRQKVEYAQLED